jgi:hypothetical protein
VKTYAVTEKTIYKASNENGYCLFVVNSIDEDSSVRLTCLFTSVENGYLGEIRTTAEEISKSDLNIELASPLELELL